VRGADGAILTFEKEDDARAKLAELFPVIVQMEKYTGGKRTRVIRILKTKTTGRRSAGQVTHAALATTLTRGRAAPLPFAEEGWGKGSPPRAHPAPQSARTRAATSTLAVPDAAGADAPAPATSPPATSATRSAAAERSDEPRQRRVDMPVAVRILLVDVEALRHHELQLLLRPGHRDVEQPPLLLDLVARPRAHVGGDAAVDDVEDVHDFHSCPLAEWIVDRIR